MSLQHWSLVTRRHKETTARRGASDSVQGPFHLIQQFFLVYTSFVKVFSIRRTEFGRSSEGREKKERGRPIHSGVTCAALCKKHDGAELPVSHGGASLSP